MPEPPHVSLLNRYLLENPWPGGLVLMVMAIVLIWLGLSDGRTDRLKMGGVLGLAAAAVLVTGVAVQTAGERAENLTRRFVNAVVANDLVAAHSMLSDDVTLSLTRPANPRRAARFVLDRLDSLHEKHTVDSNRIRQLQGFVIDNTHAQVHLSCLTEADGWGMTPSQWVLEISRHGDGNWRIDHLTCITIAGRPPVSGLW